MIHCMISPPVGPGPTHSAPEYAVRGCVMLNIGQPEESVLVWIYVFVYVDVQLQLCM